MIDRINFVHL